MPQRRNLLRKNPSISESIKNTRENPTKNRRKLNETLERSKSQQYEGWRGCDGGFQRYKEVFKKSLNDRPTNFLLEELKVHNPNVMMLGPGKGHYAALFKKELESIGVNIHIDTLGFSKTIDKELIRDELIRKDHSPHISKATAFEHINPKEHPKLIKKIKGKYHLVIGERSVGLYGESKPYAIFQTALLLEKRGRAFLDVQFTKETLKDIVEVSKRMLRAYNKANNTDLEYKITALKDTLVTSQDLRTQAIYIQIDRVN
ncbi:hypothetical protein GW835_01775 [archaeon]|nr:hypothetical protein [archaeon]NCP79278.1 hypothetical protein [archaeon]NCP98263.1 hypothetical protein [archaeon]NCQ07045.1 hypothetical protein [archaeon]NCQ50841.1 hypothetical protein [archaeon]